MFLFKFTWIFTFLYGELYVEQFYKISSVSKYIISFLISSIISFYKFILSYTELKILFLYLILKLFNKHIIKIIKRLNEKFRIHLLISIHFKILSFTFLSLIYFTFIFEIVLLCKFRTLFSHRKLSYSRNFYLNSLYIFYKQDWHFYLLFSRNYLTNTFFKFLKNEIFCIISRIFFTKILFNALPESDFETPFSSIKLWSFRNPLINISIYIFHLYFSF